MDKLDEAIEESIQRLKCDSVRPNQRKVIESYIEGKDVLFCSPTGSGKSLTFEIAPLLYKHLLKCETATVIVISPLIALMRKQTDKCVSLELKAVYLNEVDRKDSASLDDSLVSSVQKLSVDDICDGEAEIIFTSPESILGQHRDVVARLEKGRHLKAIFVDEAHCISKFGISTDKNRPAFRPAYAQLGELRSLTTVPVIALTATASSSTRSLIKRHLCFQRCQEVIVSPNKKNIKYWICDARNNLIEDFGWLIQLLREKGLETPRLIIFFRRTRQIGDVYAYLHKSLGKKGYHEYKTNGPNDYRNRLFDMFHSMTNDKIKENICSSFMDPLGIKRVVLVSTSFSMGLDVQGVDHVIHYGPAHDVEDYLQETGRAGRDPDSCAHAILMKYKTCLSGRNIVTSRMRNYCRGTTCRREELLSSFEASTSKTLNKHDCCDVCSLACKCECQCEEECQCQSQCSLGSSVIMTKILASQNSHSESSSESSSEEDETSDSDVDEYTVRKPIVLVYSSDSD